MMDGANVADSSWRSERQSEALRGSKLTYRFCEGLKGVVVGRGVCCGRVCLHIHRIVYFIFRLPEMLLLADTVGCHEVSPEARINWCL